MIRRLAHGAVILAALLAGPPAGAAASVQVTDQQIVVTAPSGARVVVTRTPFRLAFVDASGQTVLREAAPALTPLPVPPTPQHEFGTISPPPPTLYAPLGFLVGTQNVTQETASQWEGNLTDVTQGGVKYSAQAVVGVQAQGSGVRLTLSTDDPSGRRLTVTITPVGSGSPDTLAVTVRPTPDSGVATMADSFASPSSEAFHGFGGRHNSLDQHASEFYNWLQQENLSSGSASGLTSVASPGQDRYLFPNGPQAAYYVQSSFVSSAGYGFLLARDEISHWRMDSDRSDAWQAEVGAPALDYIVVPAAPPRAIAELTAMTGRQPVPPSWAAGSIFDRLARFPSDPASQYAQEVQSDIDNIDRHHLHVDAYRIEAWAELPRSVLARFISELRARDIHPMLYFRAFVGQDASTGTDDPNEYNEAIAKGYVATHADGSPYTFTSNFNAPAAVIDFTNPAAVRWWQGRIKVALDLGADGFMQDFGEQVLYDMHFHDGETGATMHNHLPVLYDHATRQELDAYERAHPGRHIFFYTRSGYSGTPGDAAYENANFPGDETTDWTRSAGIASLTTDMLNRAVGGAYGFSTDIGGYFDIGPYSATTKELFVRWAEWTALSPLFRLHGSILNGLHAPWTYDQQTVDAYNALTALHLAARPLILRLWQQADMTGVPVTRPLWLAYPGDRTAAAQDQEWLLGPDVLVAPVVDQGATTRAVDFPAGCWVRPDTGTRYTGPSSATVPAALTQLPYFFRCGTRPFAPVLTVAGRACPVATGRLRGVTLGPVRLGEGRTKLRARFRRLHQRRTRIDVICLQGEGIRVGYRGRRVVLALTANRHYALRGLRAGARVKRVRGGWRYVIGANTWYVIPGLPGTGVLKLRLGVVEEVGIAARALTRDRRAAGRFLRSFG